MYRKTYSKCTLFLCGRRASKVYSQVQNVYTQRYSMCIEYIQFVRPAYSFSGERTIHKLYANYTPSTARVLHIEPEILYIRVRFLY